MSDKISDILRSSIKEKEKEVEVELPQRWPTMIDWIWYWFGDPSLIGSPAIPMKATVCSGNPYTGQINGIAFIDPGLDIRDIQGNRLELPPLIPFAGAPYCSAGNKKLTWCTMDDYKVFVRRRLEQVT